MPSTASCKGGNMKTTSFDRVVEQYLSRLRRELSDLPKRQRDDLIAEIGDHVAQARTDITSWDEAEARALLDRLGEPSDIAAEARERLGVRAPRSGPMDVITLILL